MIANFGTLAFPKNENKNKTNPGGAGIFKLDFLGFCFAAAIATFWQKSRGFDLLLAGAQKDISEQTEIVECFLFHENCHPEREVLLRSEKGPYKAVSMYRLQMRASRLLAAALQY